MALSKLPSVGHLLEKLNRKYHTIALLVVTFCVPLLNAESVSEVAALIKEGKLIEARSLTAEWGDDASLTDAQLFLKAISTQNARQAAGIYETLINRFPESGYSDDALFRLALWRYAGGFYLASRQYFRKLMRDFPDSPLMQRSLYWIGLTYQAAGEADSARFFLEKTLPETSPAETTALANNQQQNFNTPAQPPAQPSQPVTLSPKIFYTVQVGAFAQQNGALLRKAFYERQGYNVRLSTKKKDDTLFYLVWVGRYDNADEARALGIRLGQKYGVSYTIVSE